MFAVNGAGVHLISYILLQLHVYCIGDQRGRIAAAAADDSCAHVDADL